MAQPNPKRHEVRDSQGAEFLRRLISLWGNTSIVESPSGEQILVVRDPRSPLGFRAEPLTGAGYGEGLTPREIQNNALDPNLVPFRDSGFRVYGGKAEIAYPVSNDFLKRKATAIPSIRKGFVGQGAGFVGGAPVLKSRAVARRGNPEISSSPRFLPLRGKSGSSGFPLRRNRPRLKQAFSSPTFGPSTGKYRFKWDGPYHPFGYVFPFTFDVWGPVFFQYELEPNTPFEVAVAYHHGNSDYPRLEPPIAPLRQILPVNGGTQGPDGIFRVPKELYEFSFLQRPEEEDLKRILPAAFQPSREEKLPAAPILVPGYRPLIAPSLPQKENEDDEGDNPAITRPGRIPSPARRKKEEGDEDKVFYPPNFYPGRFLPPRRRERIRRNLPKVKVPSAPGSMSRPAKVDWERLLKPYRLPQPWEFKPGEMQPGGLMPRAVRIYFPPARLVVPIRELELEGQKQPARPPALQTVPECRYRELNLSGKLSATPCGAQQPQEFSYSGLNFKGLESQIAALSEKIDLLISGLCDNPAIAATPEWWQLRPGSDRPQLILLFAPSPRPGTPRESAKWQISIPHYSGGRLSASPVPTYTKGNCMGRLLLKDGSAVIVNCVDESECQRVLGLLQPLIDPAFVSGASIALSYRLGKPIQEKLMVACYARYYSSGQNSGIPDWHTKFT